MKLLIELSKNKDDACWQASWDKFTALDETPEGALASLLEFPEVREAIK